MIAYKQLFYIKKHVIYQKQIHGSKTLDKNK